MKIARTNANGRFRSPVWWGKGGALSLALARTVHPSAKPLLLISMPRSGSSWIGEILGTAPNALYLREPLTQSHLATGGDTTVFDVDPGAPPADYALFAARAFTGTPVFPKGVVRDPTRWSLRSRRHRELVVKEVNPLALPWILECYAPKVICLVRHPAAIAASYWQLGWRNTEEKLSQFGARLMTGPLRPWQEAIASSAGFWRAQGVFQGAVMRIVLDSLAGYEDAQVVTYEDICLDPPHRLRGLLEFAELDMNDETERVIDESSRAAGVDAHAYSTRRDSRAMQQAWRKKVSQGQLDMIQSGYAAFELPFYTSQDEWLIH